MVNELSLISVDSKGGRDRVVAYNGSFAEEGVDGDLFNIFWQFLGILRSSTETPAHCVVQKLANKNIRAFEAGAILSRPSEAVWTIRPRMDNKVRVALASRSEVSWAVINSMI